jgi:LemA protein
LSELERESRSVLGRLIAVAENYPDLKTSQTVNDLMSAVREVENEIARHRYTYNNIAQQYNTMIDTIPSNLIARTMGFTKIEYLEFGEETERVPAIAF